MYYRMAKPLIVERTVEEIIQRLNSNILSNKAIKILPYLYRIKLAKLNYLLLLNQNVIQLCYKEFLGRKPFVFIIALYSLVKVSTN